MKLLPLLLLAFPLLALAQDEPRWEDKFRQLDQELATPNDQRTASGAPGHAYWQQQADYNIKIRLDDNNQTLHGEETITYKNNSPDALSYLWLQLDQNIFSKESDSKKIEQLRIGERMTYNDLVDLNPWFDGGFKLDHVRDAAGKDLAYTVNKTMMRVDLPQDLKPGATYVLKIKWWYNINDRMRIGGRSGYEYFEKDSNYLYTIAQFYPRMVAYMDYSGWQHKQYLGAGEFTLDFGNYTVAITVPADHIVAATGLMQNAKEVLTSQQLDRYNKAKMSDEPVIIVTEAEAIENEKVAPEERKRNKEKTWIFKAENVRDFAFASSRKFIWDAMGVQIGDKRPLAMSFYPKEGNPLWEQYSTRVVAHTIKTYSKYTIDYPYPVAQSIHAARIGMEYPMICFNGGRPEEDGTYNEGTKWGMIGVITHEVGHNFFPMIISSDERQWTWMDEGLNTFVQFLTEREFDPKYPIRRGPARNIVDYMKSDKSKMAPIMTNSESIYQFGNNAYGKPATALNILRETVMGRKLFDYAFKEYCERWAFRHPTPEDFFRTMEDASGVDLDWFWRGWFYGTDHCDMSLKEVKLFRLNTKDPEIEKGLAKSLSENQPLDVTIEKNKLYQVKPLIESDTDLVDFYTNYDPYKVTLLDTKDYEEHLATLNEEEKKMLQSGKYYYQLTVSNEGGLIMPLIFEFELASGKKESFRVPAEIWKMSDKEVAKVFVLDEEAVSIALDPLLETADINTSNNYWPARITPSRFEMFKEKEQQWKEENPMQRAKKEK